MNPNLDEKNKKGGQEMTRWCLEQASVRFLTATESPNEWRTVLIGCLPCLAGDKQAAKQTRRAAIN